MSVIIEPFRIKVVEPIALNTREERERHDEDSGHDSQPLSPAHGRHRSRPGVTPRRASPGSPERPGCAG